ncbi:hypothetical protein BJY59DRAFT_89555 [Rhodotorula toruloides]
MRQTLGTIQVSRCPLRMASLRAPTFSRQTSSSTTLRVPTSRHRHCLHRLGVTRPPSGPDLAHELTTSDSRRTTPFPVLPSSRARTRAGLPRRIRG